MDFEGLLRLFSFFILLGGWEGTQKSFNYFQPFRELDVSDFFPGYRRMWRLIILNVKNV